MVYLPVMISITITGYTIKRVFKSWSKDIKRKIFEKNFAYVRAGPSFVVD